MRFLLASLLFYLLSSCSVYKASSYKVKNTTASETKSITEQLGKVASELKMRNDTSNSKVKNTLSYHDIPWDQGHWYLGIGSRKDGDDTIIDLFGRSHGAKIRPYNKVKNRVEEFLEAKFHGRYQSYHPSREQDSALQPSTAP